MPRFLPTVLMTQLRLEYETAVQTGLQFTIPLCLSEIGRIVKADTPGFSSSPPVLIVLWLEVSVLILSARLLITKLILAPPVCSSCCISDASIFYLFFSEVLKQQKYRQKYLQKNTCSSGIIFNQFFPCKDLAGIRETTQRASEASLVS